MTTRPLFLPWPDATPVIYGHNNGSKKKRIPPGLGALYRSRRRTTVNMLPDGVMLEIFHLCQIESNSYVTSFRPGSGWFTLVHVCRRWRHIVLVSPRRLDLTLLCTYRTPVRKHLGCLPPFPIIVDYLTFSQSDLRSPAPNYEDDIVAALEHSDRVRSIKLPVTISLLEMAAPVMREPFLALKTLWLSSKDRNAPVLSDPFLNGPAPQLSQIFLEGISFPALPTLLLSANNLIDLQLKGIPQSGYISPETMVTSLASLNRLDSLCIWFKAPTSRLQLRSSPESTRHILLSLVTFNFYGSSKYLEHLLAQIDTPTLRGLNITYFNQLDFQVPQLSQFIRRTEHLELAQSRHSQGRIRISSPYVELMLDFEEERHHRSGLTLCILCKWPDWQVFHVAKILGQSPAMLSNVDHLSIDGSDLQLELGWKDRINDIGWPELLRQFTAVKMLHGSKHLARYISLGLDGVRGEMITVVLPALTSLLLEDQPVRSVKKFLAAREISGHPVIFVNPHHNPTDLLVDGFIAHTFASDDANIYLKLLLPAPSSKHFLQYYGILTQQDTWYITRNSNLVQGTLPGLSLQPTPLLDYRVTTSSMVVPQRRWTPADEVDGQRHSEYATLRLPIFFVNRNGGLGLRLPDIFRDGDHDLQNANNLAPLGGRAWTHIWINWPGYGYWNCQIPSRDETHARNLITVGRFMQHIATSVDKFFKTCMSSSDVRNNYLWQIGAPGGITREDVRVIGAINICADSWMLILQLDQKVF